MLNSVIYLKSIILAGCILNFFIPIAGLTYSYYEEHNSEGAIMLTTGDLGAIRAASDGSLTNSNDEIVNINGGDSPLAQY